MEKHYALIRAWQQTARQLKIIAAHTGESMIAALHRLVTMEYQRLGIWAPSEPQKQEEKR